MTATAVTERKVGAGGVAQNLKDFSERLKGFYTDVRTEMKKVTRPSWKETRATTIVVLITVALFGAFFFIVDLLLAQTVDKWLAHLSGG
jgi:preprotein translocase SecE subunit